MAETLSLTEGKLYHLKCPLREVPPSYKAHTHRHPHTHTQSKACTIKRYSYNNLSHAYKKMFFTHGGQPLTKYYFLCYKTNYHHIWKLAVLECDTEYLCTQLHSYCYPQNITCQKLGITVTANGVSIRPYINH